MSLTSRTLLISSLVLALGVFGSAAMAQTAGGYTAGAGLPPAESPPEPAHAEDDRGYQTQVESYRSSPPVTQDRNFTQTRFWRLDPGRFEVEQWYTGQYGHGDPDHFLQTEIEFGLAPHVQVDIYANAEIQSGWFAKGGHTGVSAEVRYAIPKNYGEIWGNPTLYLELTAQYYNSPRIEGRLLLGGEVFTPRLLLAVNLHYERNVFIDPITHIDAEIGADVGVNYELVPNVFRVGAEMKAGFDNHGHYVAGAANLPAPVLLVGPGMIVKHPSNYFKVMAAFLFGTMPEDPRYEPVVIVASQF